MTTFGNVHGVGFTSYGAPVEHPAGPPAPFDVSVSVESSDVEYDRAAAVRGSALLYAGMVSAELRAEYAAAWDAAFAEALAGDDDWPYRRGGAPDRRIAARWLPTDELRALGRAAAALRAAAVVDQVGDEVRA